MEDREIGAVNVVMAVDEEKLHAVTLEKFRGTRAGKLTAENAQSAEGEENLVPQIPLFLCALCDLCG